MLEFLQKPWPWYIAGPLIGLTVPLLLILGNKSFGISSSFRHICSYCLPTKLPFFQYDRKKEIWNLYFVLGIFLGGIVTALFIANPNPVDLNPKLITELNALGINQTQSLIPDEILGLGSFFGLKSLFILIVGGFLVGFGTRYAGGCTSGHTIMGISNLQWPSLVATIFFFIGGLLMANFILPWILKL